MTILSEQNIVDCARNKYGFRLKCKEGHEYNAYAYILQKGGIESSKKYPYTGKVSENIRKSDITMCTGFFFTIEFVTCGYEICYFEKVAKTRPFLPPLKCWDLIFKCFYSKTMSTKLEF